MLLPITALYAGLIGIMAIVLGLLSGFTRSRTGVSLGADSNNPEQLLASRRHGNLIEWAPIFLLLLGVLELNGSSGTLIHALGAVFVVSRLLHASGLSAEKVGGAGRALGAAGSLLSVLVASVIAIISFI
ncbi:MAG: hypothetical protein CMQ49_01210 [Gammaproteobacteria bacterium]|nr:hypothetical protein [Gammaproteobacteria bacterium]|tara:strand:- start:57 stop:446 length:390 start_codon:yes stop_codon:yes gene_type:complete